ncbi:biotin/lipoyl-binding protein, partial [Rhizobium ruizarguesonis]
MNKIVSGSETGAKTGAASDLAAVLAASGRQGKRSRWRGRLLILLILIAAAAVAAYFYMGRGQSELSYDTQPAKRGDLTVLVTATGSVQPTEQVDISSELSGTVRDVNVDYNSTVTSGEVLALLDTNKLEADVKSSRAKLNSAKANVVKANADMQSAGTSLE